MAKDRPQNKNLRPQAHKLTVEEQSLGGKKSGESRRTKKPRAEIAKIIASADVTNPKSIATLKALGVDAEDATNDAVVVASLYKSVLDGNMTAYEKWERLTEQLGKEDEEYNLPARVIGKAFVDINREIVPNKKYVFKGGRGGLKSSYISLKIPELMKNNPNMHACIVRKVQGTLRDSVYAQMKWAINELGLNEQFEFTVSPLEIRYKKTGQTIFFRGCDDPIKLKSIKPAFGYIGILWIEERDQLAGDAEERSVKQSVLRGGDKSYEFVSYNPPKTKNSWVNKEELIPDNNRIIHTSTYIDAPVSWLGQKFIDDAEHLKEINPSAYEHEYLGIPNGEGGNVFEYLEIRDITDEEIQGFDTIYQGVDWGWYPDPFAFVRVAYDHARDTVYIFDEYYVNKTMNRDTAQWIVDKGYNDYPITCDSAENKSINDFRDYGLPARPAVKGAGSVEYGMKWLQGRKIVIDIKRCPNACQEFSSYEYLRDKEDNVISGYPDKNNHTIDATRYALEQFYNRRGNNA